MRVLVLVAVGWASGVLAEGVAGGSPALWAAVAMLAGGGACLVLPRRQIAALTVLIVGLSVAGGGLSSTLVRQRAAHDPGWPEGDAVFEGVVARAVERGDGWRRAVVDVDGVVQAGGLMPAPARVLVTWSVADATADTTGDAKRRDPSDPAGERSEPSRDPLPGDRVRFAGTARPPRGYWNEGAFDRERLMLGRGLHRVVTARPPGVVRLAGGVDGGPIRWAEQARHWLGGNGDPHAGGSDGEDLLQALVLGRRTAVRPAVDDAFRRAGVSHVLSVSGLHLMAVAMLLFAAVRRLALRLPGLAVRVAPELLAAAVAAPAAVAYTLITAAEIATVRALVCALLLIGGAALGRRVDALTALALAALLVLIESPWAIHEPSFQLSFAAAAALVTLATRWNGATAPPLGLARRMARWVRRLFVASLAASAATAPLTALHFGVVQPAGVLANLVVVPAAELVVLPLGLAGVLIGGPVRALAAGAAELLIRLVQGIAAWSPVLEVPPPRPFELAAIAVALLAAAVLRPARRALLVGALGCTLAVGSYAYSMIVAPARRSELIVTFLDVGQGDAAVIEVPGGETWLIDAGGRLFGAPPEGASEDELLHAAATDPGEQAVWRFLRARRIRRLDVVVVSHPHPDHFGGLAALARHVDIGEVWIAGDEVDDPAWHRVQDDLRAAGVPVRRGGVRVDGSGAVLMAIAPTGESGAIAADEGRTVNDNSLVVRVEFAGRALLFPGDLEEDGEASLVERVPAALLAADVVKAPHHGSRTSSSAGFVAATSPAVVVVSCGPGNRFRFPASAVVERWMLAGARVYRTDRHGSVTVVVTADGRMQVMPYRTSDSG